MIESTARLLQRNGYEGTGLATIFESSGAPRGSFYHHFPGGKEELAIEAIALAAGQVTAAVDRVIARGGGAVEAFDSITRALSTWLVQSDFAEGCPVATVALEMAHQSEPLRLACAAAYGAWRERLVATLVASGAVPTGEAEALADTVIAGLEGALLLARVDRDANRFAAVAARLRLLLPEA